MIEGTAAFAGWLREKDGFTLISHVSPDGDTIGSALALYGILRAMNKRAQVVCEQAVPKVYAFLPFAGEVRPPEAAEAGFPCVIAVDCADLKRLGGAQPLFDAAAETGNIDHHRTNPLFGDYVLHDGFAAASGELVCRLWKELGAAAEGSAAQEIACCLFTAVSTDTGNFAYSNTTPETFRTAAGLLETGIDIALLNRSIYRTVPLCKARLQGYVLTNMRIMEEGALGYAFVTQEVMAELGASAEDAEGVIDDIRDIDTVEIAVLIREARDGTYKVSMRSKQYADVSAIAREFGGGGHLHAAGCTLQGAPEPLIERLLQLAKEALK